MEKRQVFVVFAALSVSTTAIADSLEGADIIATTPEHLEERGPRLGQLRNQAAQLQAR
jgi:hypothetical protein